LRKRVKKKVSYRTTLLVRIVSSAVIGMLLITVVLWVYFRNEVRSIGDYLKYGKREDAVMLISGYIGDPPSRFRAKVLSRVYGITVLYYVDDRPVWVTESRWKRMADARFPMMRIMRDMMGDRKPKRNMEYVYLSQNRVLALIFPHLPPYRNIFSPFIGSVFIIFVIGLSVFILIKKTLKPVDKIILAAERVGQGDLTYRIYYERDDDFKKVAHAFNTMTERLAAMLANQRELLHLISHELRTPLARINLALEMDDRKKSQNIIKGEIKEIDNLVEAVLDLSRMDSAQQYKRVEPVDLVSVIEKLIEDYGNRVRFFSDLKDARVDGNEMLLKKAFANLTGNAVKYSAGDAQVEIRLTEDDEGYGLTFKNNGPGLAEDELKKIWEPFFRGRNARTVGIHGKGLGLVVVNKAIELSAGEITVESGEAGPTVFTVHLPKHRIK